MTNGNPGQTDPIEALLQEVIILSNQIKKASFQPENEQMLPAPSKATLQDLVQFGPQTVPDLARLRSSSRQNVQVIVNRLERLGYLATGPNPSHKKADLVAITELGVKLLEGTERAQLQLLERLRPELADSEAQQALGWLRKLRQALDSKAETNTKTQLETAFPVKSTVRTAKPAAPLPKLEAAPLSPEEENSLPYNLL